jgi:hypothetical protein
MTSDPFDQWHETAGVRSGVRRVFHEDAERGRTFFPERLVPHLAHPAVAALPETSRAMLPLLHLYQFLLSTTHVETRVVNKGAERIVTGRSGVELSAAVRMRAFKVYCDEGYHALYSLDLAEQIAGVTGVPVPQWDYGGFVGRARKSGQTGAATRWYLYMADGSGASDRHTGLARHSCPSFRIGKNG